MEIHFTPEQQAKLAQIATKTGTDTERQHRLNNRHFTAVGLTNSVPATANAIIHQMVLPISGPA